MSQLSNLIVEASKPIVSKASTKFADFVITKLTGKSIKVFEAEGNIEADKVMTKWEKLEKPFWIQAEAAKMNREYSNLGEVLSESLPFIINKENKITDDNDFFWGLIEHSKTISKKEIQKLISKIIAGEYNQPGSCSMSTLQVIKSLGKAELVEFEKFGGLLINKKSIYSDFFSFDETQLKIRQLNNLDYTTFLELQNLGLFRTNTVSTEIEIKKDNLAIVIAYYDKQAVFKSLIDKTNYHTPNTYELTRAGLEIMEFLNPKKIDGYFDWVKTHFSTDEFLLIS